MDSFMNERVLIYTNVEKDESIFFGIFYEFYNMIREKSIFSDNIDKESLSILIKTLFKEYISKSNNKDNYIEFYDGFLDYFSSKLNIDKSIINNDGISVKKIIAIDLRDFNNSIKDIDTYYPYLIVIDKLKLSYQAKTDLIIYIDKYFTYLFNLLNSFYDEKTMIKLHELISENALKYLSNIDADNFDMISFDNNFVLENKRFVNELIKDNKYNPYDIDIEDPDINKLYSSFNDKERKIFIYIVKSSIYTCEMENIFDNKDELLKEINMSNFSFNYNLSKVSKKLKKVLSRNYNGI